MRTPWLALLVVALALGGCRDLPTADPAPLPEPGAQERTALLCAASVRLGTVRCEPAAASGGARGNLIVGGQGLHVRLTSTGVSFDATGLVLSADVTVQNLLDQPMGTDGTTASGVRVFFASGPTATDGTGAVTVLADSVGAFTAAGQPYYIYDGAIAPRATSPPRRWAFKVDPGVNTFQFQVYVDARLPAENDILHWRLEQGTQLYRSNLRGVWAASAHDMFAVSNGAVLHYDGNYWRATDVGSCTFSSFRDRVCDPSLFAVWGSGASDVYAVGAAGAVRHWNGQAWTPVADPDLGSGDLFGVWAASATDVWAVGSAGRIVHFDGADWTAVAATPVSTRRLLSVWGSGPNSAWAVGDVGTILHWDGTSWTSQSLPDSVTLMDVWGTSSTDVWATGSDGGGCKCDPVRSSLYHYDGISWTAAGPDLAGVALYAGWSSGPKDVWVVGQGGAFHWDGSDWEWEAAGCCSTLLGITGTSASNVIAVGSFGDIARNAGSGWEMMAERKSVYPASVWGSSAEDVWWVTPTTMGHRTGGGWTSRTSPEYIIAIWGSGPSDVWAVGGATAHFNGVAWSVTTPGETLLRAVWGTSSSSVWAAGDGGRVKYWNGTVWSVRTVGTARWNGLWGSAATDVFLVGSGGAIQRWNGTVWTPMNSATGVDLLAAWGSGPGDVYAVGEAGTVLHYDGNAAGLWHTLSTPAPADAPVTAVWGAGANDVYLLVNRGLDLVHWDGASWRTVTSLPRNADVHMSTIWGSGARDVYLGGDDGTVVHGQR